MAASKDSGARGFPAFPARKGGRARGQSFWAGSFTQAVEDTWPEEEPLKQGRAFSRTGRIGPIAVGPGRITAQVYGGDEAYTTVITLRELDDQEWELLWDKTADRPAVTESLLAGELPEDLLEAVEDARLRLLPGYGDLDADCDCDALDHPCPHATALCYQLSWHLDTDPWLLLLVRGRGAGEAVEELKSELLLRAMTGGDEEDEEDGEDGEDADGTDAEVTLQKGPLPGVDPLSAWSREASPLPGLPSLPPAPAGAGEPVTGIEADPLEQLVADAAVRARSLLAYARGLTDAPAPELGLWQDTVRIAATHPDPRVAARLRQACGRPSEELDRAAEAWRTGGAAGLEVLERAWSPSAQETARARAALSAGWEADELPELQVQGNHWTPAGQDIQLRLGRDGRWYPYRRRADAWWPAGAPHGDPSDALVDLTDD
ncbi:hypothetical protein OG410_42145 [Streptomyces sp. NBC_00659]|uniref:SWIM zinc finger family protein n=1 Tax=Streptomyces sp. NBC_00659 TaxID=2903669 RepID=UPI002E33AFAD|nr:hypothetical protein [Streptomyces sp. NBC_00659]